MTESEAKTKWCPMARLDLGNGFAVNAPSACIASACMMWRWSPETVMRLGETPPPRQGYCGLAGKWLP